MKWNPKEQRHMYSYFNYLTTSSTVGSVLSLTLVVWVQTHVVIGTGALEHHFACVYVDAPSLLLACQTIYSIHVVGGPNPILQILQVIKHISFQIIGLIYILLGSCCCN